MSDWFEYAPQAMASRRRRAMARTFALFALTLAAGVGADRLPAYREAVARFDMGRAFLFTLPAILLAIITYVSGWGLRRLQSESNARYRAADDALERQCRGEEPERIRWDRIDHLAPGALITLAGGRLPLYADVIQDGARLLALVHRSVARARAARRAEASPPDSSPGSPGSPSSSPSFSPSFSPAELAPGPERTPPPWPARLPPPAPEDHAAWADFYEAAVLAHDRPADGR